ncbi:hypothetical protein M0R45_023868 [Rubus argutus]|uniref:Uncharacterized protein n=1 Tax=Rubus argutus TaxID=59490 RepID=A0AAW1WQT4_RUBAR
MPNRSRASRAVQPPPINHLSSQSHHSRTSRLQHFLISRNTHKWTPINKSSTAINSCCRAHHHSAASSSAVLCSVHHDQPQAAVTLKDTAQARAKLSSATPPLCRIPISHCTAPPLPLSVSSSASTAAPSHPSRERDPSRKKRWKEKKGGDH